MSTATIREQIEADQQKSEDAYRELVKSSRDVDPNLAKARSLIIAANRTFEQFEADVSTLRRRHQATKDLELAASLDEQGVEASKAISIETNALRELEERHKRELDEARRKVHTAFSFRDRIETEQGRLRQHATNTLQSTEDPNIEREIARITSQLDRDQETLHEKGRELRDLERTHAEDEERHRRMNDEDAPPLAPHRFLVRLRDEVKNLTESIQRSRRCIEELRASKYDPVRMNWA
ncbi:hypothetical protein K2Y11_22500 [bacterium]|nr:hypothetical protein [bacterium]